MLVLLHVGQHARARALLMRARPLAMTIELHGRTRACWPAVMDILAKVDHAFLATITTEPGGCTPVTPEEMQDLLQRAGTQSALKRCGRGSRGPPRAPGRAHRAHNSPAARGTFSSRVRRIPGGSAANVMKGLANISRRSLPCKFMGMVAKDETGAEYRCAPRQAQCSPRRPHIGRRQSRDPCS